MLLIWVADVENKRHHQGEAGENSEEKKRPLSSSPLSTFTVPITLFPWLSWGYRPALSSLLLTANLGSRVWIGVKAWRLFGYWLGSCCRIQLIGVISIEFSTLKDPCQFGSGDSGGRQCEEHRHEDASEQINNRQENEWTHHLEQRAQTEIEWMVKNKTKQKNSESLMHKKSDSTWI